MLELVKYCFLSATELHSLGEDINVQCLCPNLIAMHIMVLTWMEILSIEGEGNILNFRAVRGGKIPLRPPSAP